VVEKRDGWLSRKKGGSVERLLAKQRDGWLSRGMGGKVEG